MNKYLLYLPLIITLFISSCTKDDNNNCTRIVVEVTTDISTPTVWEDCHVYVISVNQISVTSTLTIQPGAIVKFKDIVSDNSILVSNSGQIIANGTSEYPIIFTSYKDDENGGDSNGDGSTSTPDQKDWGGIIINSNNCEFRHCNFMYGGEGPDAGTGQPTLEFSSYYGIIDYCTFAYCGGETTFNGYGVVDARSCQNTSFSITNSVFYGCIKPLFVNPFISIGNTNTFHNPDNASQKNSLNGIFLTNEANAPTSDVTWLEDEVPFVLTGSLYITTVGTKLVLGSGVIIKVKDSPAPGNKITFKEGITSIEGNGSAGVYFTSYLDDAHGGDTNGDGTASSPASSDWYGIQDYTATIGTNNFCYSWGNILYAQYP